MTSGVYCAIIGFTVKKPQDIVFDDMTYIQLILNRNGGRLNEGSKKRRNKRSI